jgi:hypothetical protein
MAENENLDVVMAGCRRPRRQAEQLAQEPVKRERGAWIEPPSGRKLDPTKALVVRVIDGLRALHHHAWPTTLPGIPISSDRTLG